MTTFNPSDKSSDITLSGGNLIATHPSGGGFANVRSTTSKASGKWYFEAVMGVVEGNNGIGIMSGAASLTNYIGSSDGGIGWYDTGFGHPTGLTIAVGDVIGVALDADELGGLIWFSKNGVWQGNPAAGTGGTRIWYSTPITDYFSGAAFQYAANATWTGRFLAASQSYSAPSGFSAWDAASSHSLTATGISAGTPTVGAPAVSQKHVVTATALTTTPALGAPAVSQKHGLTATGIDAGAPAFGSPAISQTSLLSATALATGAPILGAPAVSQAHAMSAAGLIAGTPSVGAPTMAQIHALTAMALTSGAPEMGAPSVAQQQALSATGLATGAPTVGAPTLAMSGTFIANALDAGTPSLGAPGLAQRHGLTASGLDAGTPGLGSPAIAIAGSLVPIGVDTGAPALGSPAVSQKHDFAATGPVVGAPILGAPAIRQRQTLLAANVNTPAPTLGAPGLNYVVPPVPPTRRAIGSRGRRHAITYRERRAA